LEKWTRRFNLVHIPEYSLFHRTVGVDPIIGSEGGGPKNISGLDPAVFYLDQTDPVHDVVIPRGMRASVFRDLLANDRADFVVSRGGEYFFSPSLSGISHIAAA
jgi:hypothetical protein